jgi:oligosaccharide repeat unit polymerase
MQSRYETLLRHRAVQAIILLILGFAIETLVASLVTVPVANTIYISFLPYAKSCNNLVHFIDPGQPANTSATFSTQPDGASGPGSERLLGSLAALAIAGISVISSYRLGLVRQVEQTTVGRRYLVTIAAYVIAASAFIGLLTKQHGLLGTGFAVFVDATILLLGITLRQQLLVTGHINLLSPKVLFIAAFSAYGLATPYELLFNPYYVPFPGGSSRESQVLAMWFMVLALMCVFVGSNLGIVERITRSKGKSVEEKPGDSLVLWIALITILIGLVGMYFFSRSFGGIIGFFNQPSYVGRYTQVEGYGVFQALAWQFPLALLLIASTIRRLWSRRTLILIGWLGFYLVFTSAAGARRDILIPLLGLIILIHYTRFRISARMLVPLVLVAFLVLTVQGWVRNIDFGTNPRQAITCMLDSISLRWFTPGSSEWSYQFNVLAFLVNHVPSDYPFRLTYLDAITATLPQFIVRDRPATPSAWIVKLTSPEYAALGGGFAFSSVGEAYLNFGIPGIIIVFLIVGALIDSLEGLSLRPSLTFVICFGLTLVGGLLQFPRQDMIALLKIVIVIQLLPALMVMWLIFHSKDFLHRIRPDASTHNAD